MSEPTLNPNLLEPKLYRLEDLKADPKNARAHDQRSIDAIAASLAKYGQQKPVVVNKENVVIAGNGMLAAARKLGWTTLCGVQAVFEDEKMERGFALADNRTAELSNWDQAALLEQLPTLIQEDQGMMGFLGFDRDYLHDLVGAVMPPLPADDQEQETGEEKEVITCPKCGHEF